mgnify:CR=1 FL=1
METDNLVLELLRAIRSTLDQHTDELRLNAQSRGGGIIYPRQARQTPGPGGVLVALGLGHDTAQERRLRGHDPDRIEAHRLMRLFQSFAEEDGGGQIQQIRALGDRLAGLGQGIAVTGLGAGEAQALCGLDQRVDTGEVMRGTGTGKARPLGHGAVADARRALLGQNGNRRFDHP